MKEKNKKRSWKQIVSILSCIVVFCTTYALILPAVTLSTDTFCGKEEHTHSEKCYRSETPLCGLEEGEGSEGHTHTEDCYGNVEVGRNLICGMEEVEDHVHDDSCYQSEFEYGLICGKEESEPTEGHEHNEDCYMSETPICGKEEHEHIHECYSNKEDVEDPKDWEEAYKDINKEEDAKTRILTVAKNEVGYKENEANFTVDENDAEHYYTRYGHLYEDMYGDWNNYFTGYVLKYANVKMNFDKDISKWQNKTIDDQKEEGEEGNVVFFRDDEGELRSGIVTKVDDLTKDIRVIEGDVDGEVKEERVNKEKVIAYLSDEVTIEDEDTPLAGDGVEKEEQTITQTAKDAEETVEVTAEYTKDAEIPEEAEFRVTKLEDSENGNPRFDIGFFVNDEEIEPKAEVSISIKYLNEELDGTEIVDYIHYKKDGSTETISSDVKALEDGSVETKFTTDSFSVYEADITVGVKKVEVEGADGEVEIGTEVTLTANPKGYKEGEKLYYQWQYNPVGYTEKEGKSSEESEKIDESKTNEEDWYDVKGETNKKYTFQLTYENSDYLWRVKVDNKKIKEDNREYEEKTNMGVNGANAVHKIALKKDLQLNFLTNKEDNTKKEEDTEKESENNTENISDTVDIQSFVVNRASAAAYSETDYDSTGLWDIPHTKTIQQTDANNDLYRLFLDFGPTAGSKPMDLIVIIDVSSSMTNNGSTRLDNVKKTLAGEEEKTQESYSNSYDSKSACDAAKENVSGAGECRRYWSYKYSNYRWRFPITTTIGGSEGLISKFLSLNHENRIAFGTFSSKGIGDYNFTATNEQKSGWFKSEKQEGSEIDIGIKNAKNYVNNRTANGGTNYMSGLRMAHKLLQESDPSHAKHVIFLTDGELTQAYSYKKDDKDAGLSEDNDSWLDGNINDYYVKDSGSGTSQDEVQYTVTGIKQFHKKYPTVDVTTISYDLNTSYLLPILENQTGATITEPESRNPWTVKETQGIAFGRGKHFSVSSSGTGSDEAIAALERNFELVSRGPRCTNLVLTDTLSQYVDFKDQIDIKVTAIPQEGQTDMTSKLIFHYAGDYKEGSYDSNQSDVKESIPNGDKTGENKNKEVHYVNTEIIPKVQISGKQITLTFADGKNGYGDKAWELDPTYRYELSFDVKVSPKAYDEYDQNGYLHKGSEGSDHEGNHTSEDQDGFYTNISDVTNGLNSDGSDTSSAIDAATLAYTFDGKDYSTLNPEGSETNLHKFQRPVVQVKIPEIDLLKTDGSTHALSGAEFNLYVADGKTGDIPGAVTTGSMVNKADKPYVSSSEEGKLGEISFGNLSRGTYYLVETKAPDGFNKLANTYKLEVTTKEITYYQIEVVEENGQRVEKQIGETKKAENKNGKLVIIIPNKPGQSLPNTGGTGTKLFTFSGAAVIAASGLMYGYKKKKDKRNGKGGLRK